MCRQMLRCSLGQHHAICNTLSQEATEHASQTVLQKLYSQASHSAGQAILPHTWQGCLKHCTGDLLHHAIQPCDSKSSISAMALQHLNNAAGTSVGAAR